MRAGKIYLAVDPYEQGIMVRALNDLRNQLIAQGRVTDPVDELLVKTAGAKGKKSFAIARQDHEAR